MIKTIKTSRNQG